MNSEKNMVMIAQKMIAELKDVRGEMEGLRNRIAELEGEKKEKRSRSKVDYDRIIGDLRENLPDATFAKGRHGVILGNHDDEELIIRVKYSVSHKGESPSGFFAIQENQVDEDTTDVFLFVIDHNNMFYYIIVHIVEIMEWIKTKKLTGKSMYMFTIEKQENKWVDTHDETYECTESFDNWDIIFA